MIRCFGEPVINLEKCHALKIILQIERFRQKIHYTYIQTHRHADTYRQLAAGNCGYRIRSTHCHSIEFAFFFSSEVVVVVFQKKMKNQILPPTALNPH